MSVNISETLWKCIACNKTFKCMDSLNDHKKSKKHKRSEKVYRDKHPESGDSSVFKSFCYEVMSNTSVLGMVPNDEDENGDKLAVEEDNSEAPIPTPTTLESLRICLFCNKESDGVKKNLDHMHNRHNFFILDIDCLTNLKGLLSYIAERIHLGSLCL